MEGGGKERGEKKKKNNAVFQDGKKEKKGEFVGKKLYAN